MLNIEQPARRGINIMPSPLDLANEDAPVPQGSIPSFGAPPEAKLPSQSNLNPWPSIFVAEIKGHNTGGDAYTWNEQTNINGAIVDYGTPGQDGRSCGNASHASSAIEINGATFIPAGQCVVMMEILDGSDYQYQFSFIGPLLAKVTAHTSGNTTFNPYTVATVLGNVTITGVYNGFEDTLGSPGRLGVNVASDGTVNSGSCKVKPIGNNAVVAMTWDIQNSRWTFSAPNSAQ